jgi:DNA-binding CsgD family transcriptional regulator
MALAYYRDRDLTRRETEVVSLTIRGVSNPEICEQLSISRATLRTHLNNVYRKFRDLGEVPEFMPANRIVG